MRKVPHGLQSSTGYNKIEELLDQGAFKNDQKNEARKKKQLHYSFHFHLHVSHANMASDNPEYFIEQLCWGAHAD